MRKVNGFEVTPIRPVRASRRRGPVPIAAEGLSVVDLFSGAGGCRKDFGRRGSP